MAKKNDPKSVLREGEIKKKAKKKKATAEARIRAAKKLDPKSVVREGELKKKRKKKKK